MSDSRGFSGLKREIGLLTATVVVVSNMVGSGIFTTSGFIMAELGSGQMLLLCWFLGGLFALAGALCYGELGAILPRAGGEYAYLYYAFGPVPAFISGWISLFVGFSAPIAAAAIAFATYLLGSSTPWAQFVLGGQTLAVFSSTSLLACFTVVLFSLVHYHSVRLGARVQNLLTLFKIGFILLFILFGALWGNGNIDHLHQLVTESSGGAGGFAVALIFISFAYSGWNAAAYLGGEIRNPERNLPLALTCGTALVVVLYLLLNLIYLYALPPKDMSTTLEVGTQAAVALFGHGIGRGFGIAIALGLLSVLSAMIMAGPRVYYAMARDGLFFQRFAAVNATRHTPSAAIFFQAVIAIFMILCAAYDTLLIYIGFTLSLTASLAVAGLFQLRRTAPDLHRPYRVVGYPVTPLFFIAGNLWIVVYTLYSRPVVGIAGVGTIFSGWLVYLLFRHVYGMPKRVMEEGSAEMVK